MEISLPAWNITVEMHRFLRRASNHFLKIRFGNESKKSRSLERLLPIARKKGYGSEKTKVPVSIHSLVYFCRKPDVGRPDGITSRSTFLTSYAYMAALTRWDQTTIVIKVNGTLERDSGNFRERIANDLLGQLACDLNFCSERMFTANSFRIDKHIWKKLVRELNNEVFLFTEFPYSLSLFSFFLSLYNINWIFLKDITKIIWAKGALPFFSFSFLLFFLFFCVNSVILPKYTRNLVLLRGPFAEH